jgi:hypothetical protein
MYESHRAQELRCHTDLGAFTDGPCRVTTKYYVNEENGRVRVSSVGQQRAAWAHAYTMSPVMAVAVSRHRSLTWYIDDGRQVAQSGCHPDTAGYHPKSLGAWLHYLVA